MTLPTSGARSSRSLPRRLQIIPPTHSIPPDPPVPSSASFPMTPSPSATGYTDMTQHEHAIDFATHSWDLATGGLKTLTAKRELPTRPDRRAPEMPPESLATSRGYTFALIFLLCAVLILIGGAIALFAMLQP